MYTAVRMRWRIHTKTRFHLSVKWKSLCNLAGVTSQSVTCSWGVCVGWYHLYCVQLAMFCSCARHTPVSPSLPLPCTPICHLIHIRTHYKLASTIREGEYTYYQRTLQKRLWQGYKYLKHISTLIVHFISFIGLFASVPVGKIILFGYIILLYFLIKCWCLYSLNICRINTPTLKTILLSYLVYNNSPSVETQYWWNSVALVSGC